MTQKPDNRPKISAESAELFQLVVENVKDYAIFMTDADGVVISWNPGVERLLGYTENEIIGQSIAVIFTAEDRAAEAHIKEMQTAASVGRWEDERWMLRRDGSQFWANRLVMPLKNEDGTLRGFAKVMRDDTAKKIAEEKLAQTNRRTENILSSITDAFFMLDRNLRYVYVNEATTRMFGFTETDFLGKSLSEMFPNVEDNIFHREVEGALEDGKQRVFENYYAPIDRWFENHIYPVEDGLSIITTEITARKRAEAAYLASEEKYRTLFDSIDEGFCVIEVLFDENGKPNNYRFLELNPSFEKLTGLSADDALGGKTMTEMVPDMESKWFEIYGRVAQTGEPTRFVEGSEALRRWFDVYAFRTGAPEENLVAVLFNDITKRMQSEITMREAEQRYRALVEATATAVWYANAEGALTFVGEEWTRITGQSIENILKWGWLEAIHPNDRDKTIEIWTKSLQDKTLYSVEFRVLSVSGEYRWFAVSAVPILDSEGKMREWIGSNIDITPRKQAEEERAETLKLLEAERSRLAYIFERSPSFVAVLRGANHVFELTNPAYLQLIGHREIVGKTVREALPDLVGQGYFELLDEVYQTGEPFIGNALSVEFQHTPDSALEKRFVDFVFQPIFEADRTVSGIFVHGVDITEQVEARQQAENANRLKDEFLATLSHELRTPLNAILGWSQMLQNRNLNPEEAKKALSTIERNARSQNQLIDDILDVSRIITGKLRLNVQAVNLSNVITAAVDAARPAAEAKNIRLQILLDPQAGPISGDPDRLQQVVWNLLSNAVKFTPKDGRIQVRLERINSHVEIIISDTGRGIEADFLPHVFDRFRQSDGSMTRRHGGLGLGLAIVRQIVELHGGTVSAISDGENQGATFTVHLPFLPVRHEPVSEVPRVHPKTETEVLPDCQPELNDLRVLLVDDEADSRELLSILLNSCGATVVSASSAAEALKIVKSETFDVVVSDIGMPNEDGFSLIRKIRQLSDEFGGNVPAIALTAYARAEDRVKALRSGFQMHIAKPVEPDELIIAIANLGGRMRNPK